MPRKRERFERIDVPRESPYRNVIGVVVCVAVFALLAIIVSLTWNRVQLESRLGDSDLSDSLATQASTYVPDGGYVASSDEIECVLLLTADSLDATGATLASAQILSVNTTQGTAALVSVSTQVKLTVDETATTLADLYASQGYAACVAPLSTAANVSFDHVVVSTGDVLERAAALAGSDPSDLVSAASELLSQMRTDMDAETLLSLAETLSSVGVSNVASSEAVLVAETTTDEEGNVIETGYQTIDQLQLCLALGTIVTAA